MHLVQDTDIDPFWPICREGKAKTNQLEYNLIKSIQICASSHIHPWKKDIATHFSINKFFKTLFKLFLLACIHTYMRISLISTSMRHSWNLNESMKIKQTSWKMTQSIVKLGHPVMFTLTWNRLDQVSSHSQFTCLPNVWCLLTWFISDAAPKHSFYHLSIYSTAHKNATT